MSLVLRIEAGADIDTEQLPGRGMVEAEHGLSIGRAADNDLVLPDARRVISNRHCMIREVDGQYHLIDHSRNGTFLNNDAQALARNVPVQLKAGDLVQVGGFSLAVVATASAASPLVEDATDAAEEERSSPRVVRQWAGGRRWEPFLQAAPPADFITEHQHGTGEAALPTPAAFADHVPPAELAFLQPRAHREPIPDDWDLAAELGLPANREAASPPPEAPAVATVIVKPEVAEIRAAAQPAVDAFLAASGLSASDIAAVDLVTLMQRAGQALRLSAAGLHEILSARSYAKQGFGIEHTIIGESGNNPLKFVNGEQEAMRALLVTTMPGFLVGADMVEAAFVDIKRHQVAMLAAMRAALASVCQQLSPETIEAAVDRQKWRHRALPAMRQSRCWTQYRLAFDDVASGLDNDAARIFGEDFARAYQSDGAPAPATASNLGESGVD